MAERKIINQLEISRAAARQEAARQQLAAAEKAKQTYITEQAPIITKSIGDLSSKIKGFTQAIESGKGVKNAKKSVREIMASGKDVRTGYYSGLEPLETAVTGARDVLAGITVPAAIYETTNMKFDTQNINILPKISEDIVFFFIYNTDNYYHFLYDTLSIVH